LTNAVQLFRDLISTAAANSQLTIHAMESMNPSYRPQSPYPRHSPESVQTAVGLYKV